MRWRILIWRLKPGEQAGLVSTTRPLAHDEVVVISAGWEDAEARAAVTARGLARPGDTFELRRAPACGVCGIERMGLKPAELERTGWKMEKDAKGRYALRATCPACAVRKPNGETKTEART